MEKGHQTEVISTFTDKGGNQHKGMIWPITDCEGAEQIMFREEKTGVLFPIERPSDDQKGNIK